MIQMRTSKYWRAGRYATVVCIVFFCSALYCAPALAAGALEGGPVSNDQVRAGLRRMQSKVYAYRLEYESLPPNRGGTPDSIIHRIIAAKSPGDFYEAGFHGLPDRGWMDDVDQQSLAIHDHVATSCFMFDRRTTQFAFPPGSTLLGTYEGEISFYALGWWPTGDIRSPRRAIKGVEVLRDVADSTDYRITSSHEMVDGVDCVLFELPHCDKLWIDPSRGFSVVAREFVDSATDLVVQRIELSGIHELRDGIWIPAGFRNIRFDDQATRTPTMDVRLRIIDIKVNEEVSPEIFVMKYKPGSIKVVDELKFQQVTSGGTDYIDELALWTRSRFNPSLLRSSNQYTYEAVIEVTLIVICLICSIVLVMRSKRSASRSEFST